MSPFYSDDYCLHCGREYWTHVDGACLFDFTTFVLDEARSIILRNCVKDLHAEEDLEFFKLIDLTIEATKAKKK